MTRKRYGKGNFPNRTLGGYNDSTALEYLSPEEKGEYDALGRRISANSKLSIISFLGGLALTIGGGVLYLTTTPPESVMEAYLNVPATFAPLVGLASLASAGISSLEASNATKNKRRLWNKATLRKLAEK